MQSDDLTRVLGELVRQHRRRQGLSLADLAERADVSKSIVSLIERGEANPSIETLWRVAQALGVPLGTLLSEPEEAAVRAIPKESGASTRGRSGMRGWLIDASAEARRHELHDVDLPPGAVQEAEAHPPGTTEVVVCVRGALACGPVDEEIRLGAGDAAWFRADRPHRYAAEGRGARIVNLILSP